jgi:hypothetical protein
VRADFTPGASLALTAGVALDPDMRDNLARVDMAVVDGAPVN